MITFEPSGDNSVEFTPAKPCYINRGCIDEVGNQMPINRKMYVDDNLVSATYWFMMTCLI